MTEAPGDQPLREAASELEEVREFLRSTLPFQELDTATLDDAVRALRIAYHRQGERFDAHAATQGLRILRSGAVDLRDESNKLLDRLGEGESFHIGGLNAERGSVLALVIEDALIYRLPDTTYHALRRGNRSFDRYFSGQRSRRLRRAARVESAPNAMLAPVTSVMTRDPLTAPENASVHQVAVAMAQRRVSSLIVLDSDGELSGIVTDRDLRTRVLAEARDIRAPVKDVMTRDPLTIDVNDSLFATTLLMTQRGFHHLPVLEDGHLAGIVTTSDLTLARRDDPVFLVQHLSRENSVEGMRDLVANIPELMASWVSAGMNAAQVARILTAISDAITVRLIGLAEETLGEAPVPWTWLGFGSQARAEQLLGADQDNGIVIDDRVGEADLGWYRDLAARVCDGLAACGYPYCPGGIMATTDSWRQPLASWRATIRQWAREPSSDAVMRVSIFFDIRSIYGDETLAAALQTEMLAQAGRNTIFQAALAAGALANKPPLGIFRRFVVDRDGEHRDSLDIKKRGVLPITEIVRLHALAHGIAAINTEERLHALGAGGHMAMVDSRNLADALHCVQRVRVRHQRDQVLAGKPPDNFINPRALPRLAREQLRDAFTIIDEAQGAVRQTYRAGMG